jgi:hypothetical protein
MNTMFFLFFVYGDVKRKTNKKFKIVCSLYSSKSSVCKKVFNESPLASETFGTEDVFLSQHVRFENFMFFSLSYYKMYRNEIVQVDNNMK